MLTATKLRLYPDAKQADKLARAFGCARWFWNNSLNETQQVYQVTGKGLRQFDMNARLPGLKAANDWLGLTHSQVLQSVSLNLTSAFGNFFKKRAKYPKFKSKHGRQSIQFPQSVKVVDGCKLYLPKIGHVKAVVHRALVGKLKTVTVSLDPNGHYYASILTEDGVATPAVNLVGKVLGLDVGLTHLVVTSDGAKIDNPKHVKRAQKNLARKQQKLSRKQKGSNTRLKAKLLVAKAHAHTANARKDYLHKLSTTLVNDNQVIAVENLHIKGMMKNHCLAKAIGDASWGALSTMLKYKSARAGKGYIEAGRFFASSKICSCCKVAQALMPLTVRMWTCDKCGAQHDRDINAAINIRDEASRLITDGIAVTDNGGTVSQVKRVKSPKLACAVEVGSLCL